MNFSINLLYFITDAIWSLPAAVILLSTGGYLTYKTKFIQFRHFTTALNSLIHDKKQASQTAEGSISSYQALSVSLAGTVGVGNIGAVAAAIAIGGPGAIFWMWMTAIVGMATTYCCCTLAVKFREKNSAGQYVGGPMYVIKNALNRPKLAAAFAIFTIIAAMGSGNMMSANMMFEGLTFVLPASEQYLFAMSVITAILVGIIIIGGIQRIGYVMGFVVPFMCLAYLIAAVYILIMHASQVPGAIFIIFNYALNPWAAGGGAIGAALQFGVARGLFSNEAGQGSIPIVHAVAKTNSPEGQGLIAMLGPFIDTIIICTMTALVIIVIGEWNGNAMHIEGTKLAVHAFAQGMGSLGGWIVALGMIFFSFSTIVSWSYYGEAAINYLMRNYDSSKAILLYRIVYTLMVIAGVALHFELVWSLTDLGMAFMMLPNLIALWLLVKVVQYKKVKVEK